MANTAEIKAVITAEDKASATLKGFADNTEAASGRIKTALALAGTAALAFFGKESVQAFEESQTVLTQLDAVLKSTGGSAGVTRQEAIKLSKEIENTTSVSDETALAIENMGLTFTKIHKDIFPQFTKAALDTATALNHGLKPSTEQVVDVTKMLGKAMEDPQAGLGALHRYGINVEDLKVKFQSVTDVAGRQRLIIQELGNEFGGSATAQSKTFAGQVAQLKEKMNDLQEQVGQVIVTALKPLVELFANNQELLKVTTYLILGLAAAFVTLKVAALISDVITGVGAAIQFVGTSAAVTTGFINGLSTSALLAAAPFAALAVVAVGAFIAIQQSAKQTMAVLDMVNSDIDQAQRGTDAALAAANAQYKAGKISKARYQEILAGARAEGGPVKAGEPYLVGEKGPEVFMPTQAGSIIPNNKTGGTSLAGGNVSFNINAGAYMGSQIEARKYAEQIFKSLQDLAAKRNSTVANMIGV